MLFYKVEIEFNAYFEFGHLFRVFFVFSQVNYNTKQRWNVMKMTKEFIVKHILYSIFCFQ